MAQPAAHIEQGRSHAGRWVGHGCPIRQVGRSKGLLQLLVPPSGRVTTSHFVSEKRLARHNVISRCNPAHALRTFRQRSRAVHRASPTQVAVLGSLALDHGTSVKNCSRPVFHVRAIVYGASKAAVRVDLS